MPKQFAFILFCSFACLFSSLNSLAQSSYENFVGDKNLSIKIDINTKNALLSATGKLVKDMKNGEINPDRIHPTYGDLTLSIWSTFKNFHLPNPKKIDELYAMQLMQVYPLKKSQYMLSMAIVGASPATKGEIRILFDVIAERKGNSFVFSLPLRHKTKSWKNQQVGNITYYYSDQMNIDRAKEFNKKNTEIAKKFGLEPEKIQFFMTDNYQEVLNLFGINYAFDENGKYRDGYGVDRGCIFAIMNNEDFSHDIFHYYSGKVNDRSQRNWITEEGVAYSWGNAYYTDEAGEMINQDRLVEALKKYIEANPQSDLLHLFEKNEKPFVEIAREVSLRSLLSSLICDKVERDHGMPGLLKLINCGRKDRINQYFVMTEELIGLNRSNFNSEVFSLIQQYK